MEPKIKYSSVPSLIRAVECGEPVPVSCSGPLCGDDDLDPRSHPSGELVALVCPTCGTWWGADFQDGDLGHAFEPGVHGEYADDAREFDL